MPIAVSCPECGHDYTVKDEAAGRRFECRVCGGVVEIPSLSGSAGDAPAQEPGGTWSAAAESATGREPERQEPGARPVETIGEQPSRLGRTSFLIGIGVWGLSLLGIMLSVGLVAWLNVSQGKRVLNDAEAALIGLLTCGPGCLSVLGSFIGLSLGVMGLLEEGTTKGASLGGVILNGLFLGGVVTVILVVTLG